VRSARRGHARHFPYTATLAVTAAGLFRFQSVTFLSNERRADDFCKLPRWSCRHHAPSSPCGPLRRLAIATVCHRPSVTNRSRLTGNSPHTATCMIASLSPKGTRSGARSANAARTAQGSGGVHYGPSADCPPIQEAGRASEVERAGTRDPAEAPERRTVTVPSSQRVRMEWSRPRAEISHTRGRSTRSPAMTPGGRKSVATSAVDDCRFSGARSSEMA